MMNTKCPLCGHMSLIVNLWGFTIEEEIIKIENSGHTVNIKGCVPSEKDEEAFQFECKSCGYKFGEYDVDEE